MDNQTANSAADLKRDITQDAKSATAELAGAAKEQVEAGKDQAAEKLNDLSEAIDKVAGSISENDKLGLASYVHSTSSKLASLATMLQDRSINELAEEAKELARKKPTAFILGSVMVGFGLSRFVKASTHHHHESSRNYDQDGLDQRSGRERNYPPAADFAGTQPGSSSMESASI